MLLPPYAFLCFHWFCPSLILLVSHIFSVTSLVILTYYFRSSASPIDSHLWYDSFFSSTTKNWFYTRCKLSNDQIYTMYLLFFEIITRRKNLIKIRYKSVDVLVRFKFIVYLYVYCFYCWFLSNYFLIILNDIWDISTTPTSPKQQSKEKPCWKKNPTCYQLLLYGLTELP